MDEIEQKENPLISIVMPAWNAGQTIGEAIRSILGQTYSYWELIVIDDGSADNTCQEVSRLAEKDSRICLYQNQENQGVSRARNRGVSRAKGDWVAFLDSDDLWMPEKLEKQVRVICQKMDTCLVFTGSTFIRSNTKSVKPAESTPYCFPVPETVTYRQLLKQNVISCSSVLVRKGLLLQYPMKHDEMHEDYAVWLQILREGNHACGINEPLLVYRLSSCSKSGDKWKAAKMTYRVYRFLGLNHFQAFYYFVWYVCRNLKKYYLIHKCC